MKYVINLYKIEVRVVDFSVLESKEKNCLWFTTSNNFAKGQKL